MQPRVGTCFIMVAELPSLVPRMFCVSPRQLRTFVCLRLGLLMLVRTVSAPMQPERFAVTLSVVRLTHRHGMSSGNLVGVKQCTVLRNKASPGLCQLSTAYMRYNLQTSTAVSDLSRPSSAHT